MPSLSPLLQAARSAAGSELCALVPGWVSAGSFAMCVLVVALCHPATSGHLSVTPQCGPCSCASEIEGRAGACTRS